jgi:hypothetical protein
MHVRFLFLVWYTTSLTSFANSTNDHKEADHVADLGDKVWIGGELEGLEPVGLQAEGTLDALHARRPHAARLGHAA